MSHSIAVLGGSGFVGRTLLERWPSADRGRPRFLVHRSRPSWLEDGRAAVHSVDFADLQTMRAPLDGVSCLINLLRPDGSGWLRSCMQALTPLLRESSVTRVIHASSIDVYGMAPEKIVTEDTPVRPHTPYQREHADLEAIVASASDNVVSLRLGAVFGKQGRNLEALVSEMLGRSVAFPALRRALYGRRRMHLVSVENVADAILLLATSSDEAGIPRMIVTDDAALENNFSSVQDIIADEFGRAPLTWVPALPTGLLRRALAIRGRSAADADRRFANDALLRTGFQPQMPFADRVRLYARHVMAREGSLQS